jgi:hypothetical protein
MLVDVNKKDAMVRCFVETSMEVFHGASDLCVLVADILAPLVDLPNLHKPTVGAKRQRPLDADDVFLTR